MGYVYFIQVENQDLFKIGLTKGTPEKRLAQLQTAFPSNLCVFGLIPSQDPKRVEHELHTRLQSARLRGEWFRLETSFVKKLIAEYVSFCYWLGQFQQDDTIHGDFARDSRLDKDAMNIPNTYSAWKLHVGLHGCTEAKLALAELWRKYRNDSRSARRGM